MVWSELSQLSTGRKTRESKDVYKPSIVKEKVGVQRLILIQPAISDLEDKAEEGQ